MCSQCNRADGHTCTDKKKKRSTPASAVSYVCSQPASQPASPPGLSVAREKSSEGTLRPNTEEDLDRRVTQQFLDMATQQSAVSMADSFGSFCLKGPTLGFHHGADPPNPHIQTRNRDGNRPKTEDNMFF